MLDKQSTALLFIDVQGNLAAQMPARDLLFKRLQQLLRGALVLRLPILWIEQNPQGLGVTLPQFVALLEGRQPLVKQSFSCWQEPSIRQAIIASGATQLLLCGIETHVCVHQSALDLLAEGYEVHIASDAVASRNPLDRELALQRLITEGVKLSGVEMALFELLKGAEDPLFRQMLPLLK